MTETIRYYNESLAQSLDDLLNEPYNYEEGPECDICHHTNSHEYDITGYVIDDGSGVFVEKKCERCGAIINDGDGDFHEVYRIIDNQVLRMDE